MACKLADKLGLRRHGAHHFTRAHMANWEVLDSQSRFVAEQADGAKQDSMVTSGKPG